MAMPDHNLRKRGRDRVFEPISRTSRLQLDIHRCKEHEFFGGPWHPNSHMHWKQVPACWNIPQKHRAICLYCHVTKTWDEPYRGIWRLVIDTYISMICTHVNRIHSLADKASALPISTFVDCGFWETAMRLGPKPASDMLRTYYNLGPQTLGKHRSVSAIALSSGHMILQDSFTLLQEAGVHIMASFISSAFLLDVELAGPFAQHQSNTSLSQS